MALTIELTPEEETRLQAAARAAGIEATEYARQLLAADLMTQRSPMTGAEMIAYWQREGVLGSYGDPEVDAPELARRIRECAQTREVDAAEREMSSAFALCGMILDTDVLIDLKRTHPPAMEWLATLTTPPWYVGSPRWNSSTAVGTSANSKRRPHS